MLQAISIKAGSYLNLTSGRYFIEDIIGSGGFGTVYKARKEDSIYALKLNRFWELQPFDRKEIKKRIKQEFEISNSIQSLHIVHSYEYEEVHENPVLIMEYCPDGSLRNKITKNASINTIDKIAIQILNGLNILHSFQVIHRDLKPENILFNGDLAKLTDFGVSTILSNRLTQKNIRGHALRMFATLNYSPPEQSQKNQAFYSTGPTNDIFSFGVIMFELITKGLLPFGNLKEISDGDAALVEKRKRLGKWDRSNLSKFTKSNHWDIVIDRCLAPDPGDRYQKIEEIIDLLSSNKPQLLNSKIEWRLRIKEGLEKGKGYNLTKLSKYKNKKILTIGRFDEQNPFINDISIKEEFSFISHHHGTFEQIVDDNIPIWFLRDGQFYSKNDQKGWHSSRNGIWVNSKKIDEYGVQLSNRDEIKIGNTIFEVICE